VPDTGFTRRGILTGAAGLLGAGAAAKLGASSPAASAAAPPQMGSMNMSAMHMGLVQAKGSVDPKVNGFDPSEIVRDFDWGKTRRLASGGLMREWQLVAYDKEIEVVGGVKVAAWAYNGRVPGPTLRCREGESLRIRFVNAGSHAHTIHFHGIHRASMDGVPGLGGGGMVEPGSSFTYEFFAEPFGLHHYHCHSSPLAVHLSKGLYGMFIVDPKQGRPEADELVLVQNAFDLNFDEDNDVYAANTVAFHYMYSPIRVKRDRLVRLYVLNIVEFDSVNSFHLHANFFHRFPTGTSLEPTEYTDTIIQGQAQRDILELRFPYTGRYMFHAHKSEFAELGWMGFFEVVE
jgi:FtsP/CotA-like multicopper oxidase with cupredoxin domain